MSASTPVTGEPAAAEKEHAQKKQSSGLSFQRFAEWALPLAIIFLLLGALAKAVRAGQLRWEPAGISAYVVSLAMWLFLKLLTAQRILLAQPAASSSVYGTTKAPPPPPPPAPSRGQFATFADWFFPSVAIVSLVGASYMAAAQAQLPWVALGAIACAGCLLVWAGWLISPAFFGFEVSGPSPSGATSGSSSEPWIAATPRGYRLPSPRSFAVALSCDGGRSPGPGTELRPAMALSGSFRLRSLCDRDAYNFAAWEKRGRDSSHCPNRRSWCLAAILALALRYQHLSWVAGAVIGACGCVALWLSLTVQSAPRKAPSDEIQPPYSSVPYILIASLLAFAGVAVYKGELPAHRGAALVLLGGLALWFSWMFVVSVLTDGPPQVESNWTGLGGGVGGWRCSPSLIFALCALTLAIVAGSGLYQASKDDHPSSVTEQSKTAVTATGAGNLAHPESAKPQSPASPKPEQH